MSALIGIFGLEFALIGPLAPAIMLTDAAFALMGSALIPFSKGVGAYADVMQDRSYDDIKKMAALIGVFAGEFSLLALTVPFVTLGATAVLIISGALNVLGRALQEWSKAEMDQDKLDLLCVSIDRLKLAFMGDPKGEETGGGGGIGGFFKKIGKSISGAITGAFDLGPVTTTAAAIGIISGALTVLGRSLQNWNDVKFSEKKLDLICVTIDRLKLAFQGKPSNTGESGNSFLGKLKDSLSGAIMDVFNIEKVKLTANALTTAGFTIKA